MNKNIFTILTFLFGIPGFVYAQDFKPEEQAQGYLNNKNVLLDHTTGSFNYNVPLFELISGYYKLPISLQYTTARDLNTWSLQTGGIVTRIVRGGVPDDNTQKGYPFTINKDTVLQDDLDRVNTHKRDGESDILMASFNGRSVYFIIKKDGNTLVAEPLERTNVKIECKYVNNRIMGWDVLDENGIRYIYNLSSSVKNLSRDAPILLNQIGSSDEYISSWYLSQVKIPNSESIYYYYKLNDTITTTSSYQSHTTPHNESNRLTFTYGKPMLDIPLDYESIRQEVEDNLFHAKEIAMTSATSSLAQIAVSQRFQGAGERSSALAKAGAEVNIYRQYETVLGIFSSLGKVRFPSPDVLQVIDELMDFYEPYDNNGYLHRTKRLIEQMLTTKKRIHTKEIYPTTKYTVYYPVLEKITSKNQEAYFEYTGGKLKSITLSDPTGKQTRKVIFTKRNFTLGDIIWLGSDGTKIGKSSFFYTDPRPSWNVLQKIITPEKAEIELTYENNRCGKGDSVDGIRIKTLVLRDGGGRVDTMKFNYPYPGYRVYDYIGKIDTLNYSSFSDYIHSREYIYRGNVLINRGNSGIYYHYVEEEFVGKGTVSYLFSVPRSSASNPEHVFPFWLCGVPLGKAMYDKRGNLVKLEKSTYYTDRSVAYLAFGEEWFSTCPEEFKYNRKVLQLKADDYYFDYEKLGKFYSEQEKVMLIAGKGTTQPYYFDPVDLFYNNISPRVGFSNHVLNYQLVYGGKTLLNRTRKYLFTGIISTGPSITHLTGNLPSGNYCTEDVEYRYDNPGKHANPTRTIYHDTRGNEQVVVRRSPLDFTGEADLVINEMVSAHYIAPVIKEQRLFRAKNSGQYTIIEESHTEYQKRTNASGENIFLPCKANIYTFHAPATIDTLFPKLDNKLYSRSDTACVQRKNTAYRQLGNKYLPVEGLDQGSRTICCYDQERHNLILKAQDVLNDQVDAVDRYRVSLIGDAQTLKNKDLCGLTLPRKLSVVPRGVTAYRLFLLVKPDVSSLNVPCIQKYTNGTTTPRSLSISVSPGIWQLVTCDLTIPNNTSSLEIDLSGFNSIALSVLAPQNTIFEGYSFDQIGRKFGTLNQQGQLERYDYDPLGRVTRVWDGKSNLLKELKYRIIL